MNNFREWFSTGLGLAIVYFLVIVALIAGGALGYLVFVEPRAQDAYQQGLASKLSDWCSAPAGDAWNQSTLASIKSDVVGEPKRFDRLETGLKLQVKSALDGDRVGACGPGAK